MAFLRFLVPLCLLSACAAASPPSRRTRRVSRPTSSVYERTTASLRARVSATLSTAPTVPSTISVLDFGAVGDFNVTDNTFAFQTALNSLAATGGTVLVPSGGYMFNGTITLPQGVSLVGTYTTVPAHDHSLRHDGSLLLPRAGRGSETGAPFVLVGVDCTLRGFSIVYPDVDGTVAPVPYPWTIQMLGDNAAVQDVELLNSWNGINATLAHRHYIARVQGQPVNIGIFVDATYDIGRIEDVHWNPWFSDEPAYISYQSVYGQGFVFARTDWEYVINTFVFGMSVGYRFIESAEGSCNGNFIGIGADESHNASVLVESADPWGILIANAEFTAFSQSGFGPTYGNHTQIIVAPSNKGAVRITNSAFWGPSVSNADISGTGSVGFESCIFNAWDAGSSGAASIHAHAGATVSVRGCEWQNQFPNAPHVLLDAGVKKAIVSECIIEGPQLIVDNGALVKPVVVNNVPG